MTVRERRLIKALAWMVTVATSCLTTVAQAEIDATLYSGASSSRASDVHLTQPGDTRLTFANVAWDDKSFENPIYWGLRLTYWLPRADRWGIALDFTHAKIQANLDATVGVSGTRLGTPVNAQEPLRNTFDQLAMSHGFNLLTLNAMYRWKSPPHLQPFVGLGGGIAYPHVEVHTSSSYTDEYQIAGWVANAMVGVHYNVKRNFAIFAEYKLSYADMHADLSGSGGLDTAVWTNHFNLGVTYHFTQTK